MHGLAIASAPVKLEAGMVDHATIAGKGGDLGAGASETVSADLKPGKYELICHIAGHYQAGQKLPVRGHPVTGPSTPHVLIAGGGVAALETLMALRDLAGERVSITLVAPDASLTYRPMTVAQPFNAGHARDYDLAGIAREFQAALVRDTVVVVLGEGQSVRCASGRVLSYDHLVIATGAKAEPAFPSAITFGDDPAEERLHGMLADLEQGYLQRVAFVVPGETAWTLPVYELALMTARQAWNMGMDRVASRS